MSDFSNPIRSYVIRASRFSKAQKRAYQEGAPRYLVPFAPAPLDWEALFPGLRRRIVEIGFGMGDITHRLALAHPDTAFLGIETHRPGVGKLLGAIEAQGIENLRVVEHDAAGVLGQMLTPGSIDGFHLFCPDPWPKKRHHKRRLFQAPFAALLARLLLPGGYVHVSTDWEPYARVIIQCVQNTPGLSFSLPPRPLLENRGETKFESRGRLAGREIHNIIAVKE